TLMRSQQRSFYCTGGFRDVRYWPKAAMPKNAIDVAIGGKADMPFCTANVRFWPKADIPSCTAQVRFRGQSGHHLLQRECLLLTQSGHVPFLTANQLGLVGLRFYCRPWRNSVDGCPQGLTIKSDILLW